MPPFMPTHRAICPRRVSSFRRHISQQRLPFQNSLIQSFKCIFWTFGRKELRIRLTKCCQKRKIRMMWLCSNKCLEIFLMSFLHCRTLMCGRTSKTFAQHAAAPSHVVFSSSSSPENGETWPHLFLRRGASNFYHLFPLYFAKGQFREDVTQA